MAWRGRSVKCRVWETGECWTAGRVYMARSIRNAAILYVTDIIGPPVEKRTFDLSMCLVDNQSPEIIRAWVVVDPERIGSPYSVKREDGRHL